MKPFPHKIAAALFAGVILLSTAALAQSTPPPPSVNITANTNTFQINNYASIINNAIGMTNGSATQNISPVFTYIVEAIGTNGVATVNGGINNVLQGTGVRGQAEANGIYNTNFGFSAGVNGSFQNGIGTKINASWDVSVPDSNNLIHLKITVTVTCSSGSYTQNIDVVLNGVATLAYLYNFVQLPNMPPNGGTGGTGGTGGGTGGSGSGGTGGSTGGSTSGGSISVSQLQNWFYAQISAYVPNGTVNLGNPVVVE